MTTTYYTSIQEIGTIRGVTVAAVAESATKGGVPHTIRTVLLNEVEGVTEIAAIDAFEKGATGRCIAIAETIYEALQSAEYIWLQDA